MNQDAILPNQEQSGQRRPSRAEEIAGHRRRRNPAADYNGTFLRLGVDPSQKDPNYEYHWFNDDKGSLEFWTQQDDWDFVENGAVACDGRNLNESDKRIRRIVGKNQSGQPLYAYWCRKPKEWFDADQAEQVKRTQERYRQAVHNQTPGAVDGISQDDLQASYIPAEIQSAINTTEGRERAQAIRRSQRFQKG